MKVNERILFLILGVFFIVHSIQSFHSWQDQFNPSFFMLHLYSPFLSILVGSLLIATSIIEARIFQKAIFLFVLSRSFLGLASGLILLIPNVIYTLNQTATFHRSLPNFYEIFIAIWPWILFFFAYKYA